MYFPVVELSLTFRRPARFGQVVEVRTRLSELSSRALLFRYWVLGEEGLLAEGFTRHLCQVGGRAARIPEDILKALSVLDLG